MNNQVPQKTENNTNNEVRKMPKSVQQNPKYTENWINIKGIKNGIIFNNNNEMITGVKIRSKNIFILDSTSVEMTLAGLMNFYNTIDYEFWILILDRPVDVSVYQAELQLLFNKTQSPVLRKIITQDIQKGDLFKQTDTVDVEYYLLFKEKNMDKLQKKIRDLINGLAGADLVSSQTTNEDLRSIIDNLLNGEKEYNSGTVIVE